MEASCETLNRDALALAACYELRALRVMRFRNSFIYLHALPALEISVLCAKMISMSSNLAFALVAFFQSDRIAVTQILRRSSSITLSSTAISVSK